MSRWFRWLRYLLVWPAIGAYRRRARRSLRWRLAGYNLATLIAGLATAFILVGALAAVSASARRYADEEPADDARKAAEILLAAGAFTPVGAPNPESAQPLLDAMAAGDLPIFRGPDPNQFDVRPRRFFQGVRGMALLGPGGETVASTPGWLAPDAASPLVQRSLAGSVELRENALLDSEGPGGVGAYPVVSPAGDVLGVVVVDKAEVQAPRGWAVVRAEIRPVVTTVWVGSLLAALPGLAVAALLAVAAARSVGGRVRDLSEAAESLAEGSLDRRVAIRGEDEVASLARSFNVMAERLQQTMGSLQDERALAVSLLDANRQLVANVSHELRTPVALIRGQVEALDEDVPGNPRTAMALREIGRLEDLVTDLFRLASTEAGAREEALSPVDLVGLAREAASPLVEPAWREARVTLLVDTPEAALVVRASPAALTRVIQNLLRNGIRHAPEGGMVRLAVEPSGEHAVVRVSDTGDGIAVEDLPHVFDRFYRGDASRNRDTGGAGLGLAIAREAVERMGGEIAAESPPGEGATFTIRLPLDS